MPLSSLSQVLDHFMQKSLYSRGQLATLSGVSKRTIRNWLEGVVQKPHQWLDLLRVAQALHLNEPQTNELLASAHYPSLYELRQRELTSEQAELLQHWPNTPPRTPFQAIPALPYFVGRQQLLTQLQQTLLKGQSVAICNFKGMGGVGKTSLAAHLAYQLRPHFPDGVLWARVDTSDTLTILASFASAYGEDVQGYADVESRASVVRTLLADKRVLMVLDNAERYEQIAPLLPPTTGKPAVIITSRHDFTSLQRFIQVNLTPFSPDEDDVLTLFAQFLEPDLVQQQAQLLRHIANLLGHLPLALSIAAANLAGQPYPDILTYAQQLQDERQQLQLLHYDNVSVRLSFDKSFDSLEPELQHFFSALGAFSAEDFEVTAVANVTQTSLATATQYLNRLYRSSLVQLGRNQRYRLHSLLHTYAQEKITSPTPYLNMVNYFTQYVVAYAKQLPLLELEFANIKTALSYALQKHYPSNLFKILFHLDNYWEVTGLHNFLAPWFIQAVELAKQLKDEENLAYMLTRLGYIQYKQGQLQEAEKTTLLALPLTRELHLIKAEFYGLSNLGMINYTRGNYEQCEQYIVRQIEIAQEFNNPNAMGTLLMNLGNLVGRRGEIAQRDNYSHQALAIFREQKNDYGIVLLLINLGSVATTEGKYAQALTYLEECLTLANTIHSPEKISLASYNLAFVYFSLGQFIKAYTLFQECLTAARSISFTEHIVDGLFGLASVALEQGHNEEAEKWLQESLVLAQQLGSQSQMALVLGLQGLLLYNKKNYLLSLEILDKSQVIAHQINEQTIVVRNLLVYGFCYLALEQPVQAQKKFTEAHILAQQIHYLLDQALSLFGLAQVAVANGCVAKGVQKGEQSLALLQQMGHYKANEVKNWLIALNKS